VLAAAAAIALVKVPTDEKRENFISQPG